MRLFSRNLRKPSKTALKKAIKLRLNGLIVKEPTVGGQRGRLVIIQGADNVPSCHSISCNTSQCSDNANPGQQAMTKNVYDNILLKLWLDRWLWGKFLTFMCRDLVSKYKFGPFCERPTWTRYKKQNLDSNSFKLWKRAWQWRGCRSGLMTGLLLD